jgi:hypothetical protein
VQRSKPRENTHMAFFELRQYKVRRGKMDAWLKMFDEEIMPFQVAKGMVVCGTWHGETDPSVFVWMRRFNSERERERICNSVYADPRWANDIAPRAYKLIDPAKMKIQRVVANKKSNVQ